MIIRDHRTGIISQPVNALLYDAIRLTHFFNTHEIAVITVAVYTDGNIKIHSIVNFIGLLLAQVPLNTGAA